MKKKMMVLLIVILAMSSALIAQESSWQLVSTLDSLAGVHGIGCDPEGKVWYASFSDSSGIKVLNADGTLANQITELTVNGEVHEVLTNCRGVEVGPNGNIHIVMSGTKIFKIDYKTYEVLGLYDYGTTATKPAVDAKGYVYVGPVIINHDIPPVVLTPNLEFEFNLNDTLQTWSRAMEVSADGMEIYYGSLWGGLVSKMKSEDDGMTYQYVDPLPGPYSGLWGGGTSTINFGPDGKLWVSDEGAHNFVIYDLETMTFETFDGDGENGFNTPRGVSFSPDASIIYTCDFTTGAVQSWKKGVSYENPLVLDDFEDGDLYNTPWNGVWTTFTDNSPLTMLNIDNSEGAIHVNVKYISWGGGMNYLKEDSTAIDLSYFDGICFKAKGTTTSVRIRLRETKAEAARGWNYFRYDFMPSEDWTVHVVPFDSLSPSWGLGDSDPLFEANDLYAIDIMPSNKEETCDVYVDDITFYKGEAPLAIDDNNDELTANGFNLSQNYPNPFNPVTTINYQINQTANVKLTVYDVLGREVSVLVNSDLKAGNYTTSFQAGDELSSGIYIYQLKVNEQVMTKRMLLLK